MKDIENVVEFGELLGYAERIGIPWNAAHESLVIDEIPPMYENRGTNQWGEGDIDMYDFSDETKKILSGFMKENNVDFINVIND